MRIVCFSDSHGEFFRMWEVLERERTRGHIDAVWFAGDGCEEFAVLEANCTDPLIAFLSVAGNCDRGLSAMDFPPPAVRVISLPGHRALLVHGDACGASDGSAGPAALARRNGCDLVVHGHTHIPRDETDRGKNGDEPPVRVMNPGSIGSPRRGGPGYGVLEITDDALAFTLRQA